MNRKYTWLLLVAAAMVYALWSVNQETSTSQFEPAVLDNRGGPEVAAALARLEQRMARLEEQQGQLETVLAGIDPDLAEQLVGLAHRLDGLEHDIARQDTVRDSVDASTSPRKRVQYINAEASGASIDDPVRLAYDNDDIPDPALQVELENAEYLFDSDKIEALDYREMDCRQHYCRLGYEDYSEDAAAAALAENELLLLLSEKYGDGVTIHAGERNGTYRSLYIELGTGQ